MRTRRARRRRVRPSFDLEYMISRVGELPDSIDPASILKAMAEDSVYWDLIRQAADLKEQREALLVQIENRQDLIMRPFRKVKKRK